MFQLIGKVLSCQVRNFANANEPERLMFSASVGDVDEMSHYDVTHVGEVGGDHKSIKAGDEVLVRVCDLEPFGKSGVRVKGRVSKWVKGGGAS